jgi:hypothetical protein
MRIEMVQVRALGMLCEMASVRKIRFQEQRENLGLGLPPMIRTEPLTEGEDGLRSVSPVSPGLDLFADF